MTNLCKTDLGSGVEDARYPLIADGSNLLIIRHTAAWINKDLIVTPSEEYFTQAVTYGEHSAYTSRMGANDGDAIALQARLAALRDGKGLTSWHEGHKPLYAYWARSYPPYRIRRDSNINSTTLLTTMELGSCWQLLRFDLRALPVGLCSAFSAWWRVWNPSCIEDIDGSPNGPAHTVRAQTSLHYGAGVMRYKFAASMQPPKYHQDGGYGEADIAAVANEGNGSDYNANSNCLKYDIYNSHNGVAATAANNYYGQERIRIWAQSGTGGIPSTTPYYADIPITGNGLTSLRNAIKERGPVWAHCGFPTLDAQSAQGSLLGQAPKSTLFVYASRLELRIRATWTMFNNA